MRKLTDDATNAFLLGRAVRWFFAGVTCAVLATGSCTAAPLERCPEPTEEPDLGDHSASAFQQAFKNAPPMALGLGKDRRRTLATLIARGEDPNACVAGSSVLTISAISGELEETRMLIDGGAQVDRPLDSNGGTPLLAALGMGRYGSADLLLARGSNPLHRTDGGSTALHQLASVPVTMQGNERDRAQQVAWAARLLDLGLVVDARDCRGTTPLLLATAARNRDLAVYLLSRGADAEARNLRGGSPVDLARKLGDPDLMALFERAKSAEAAR